MSFIGVGLGSFFPGVESGIGIGNQLKAIKNSNAIKNAAATGEANYNADVAAGKAPANDPNAMLRYTYSQLVSPFLAQGDFANAEAAANWLKSDAATQGSNLFASGMLKAQGGDMKGAISDFVGAAHIQGYGADWKIGDITGNDTDGYSVSITGADGTKHDLTFKTPQDVMRFGATYMNPQAAYQQWQQQNAPLAGATPVQIRNEAVKEAKLDPAFATMTPAQQEAAIQAKVATLTGTSAATGTGTATKPAAAPAPGPLTKATTASPSGNPIQQFFGGLFGTPPGDATGSPSAVGITGQPTQAAATAAPAAPAQQPSAPSKPAALPQPAATYTGSGTQDDPITFSAGTSDAKTAAFNRLAGAGKPFYYRDPRSGGTYLYGGKPGTPAPAPSPAPAAQPAPDQSTPAAAAPNATNATSAAAPGGTAPGISDAQPGDPGYTPPAPAVQPADMPQVQPVPLQNAAPGPAAPVETAPAPAAPSTGSKTPSAASGFDYSVFGKNSDQIKSVVQAAVQDGLGPDEKTILGNTNYQAVIEQRFPETKSIFDQMNAGGPQARAGSGGSVIPASYEPLGGSLAGRGAAIGGNVGAAIDTAAARVGLDPSTLRTFAAIESGGDPTQSTGAYRGLFQLSSSEFAQGGGGNILNPVDNANAAAVVLKQKAANFQQEFGRAPTATELYLMHQQGEAGGPALIAANPNETAWQVVRRFYGSDAVAKQAIWNNVPDDVKRQFPGGVNSVSAADFVNLWANKVEGRPYYTAT